MKKLLALLIALLLIGLVGCTEPTDFSAPQSQQSSSYTPSYGTSSNAATSSLSPSAPLLDCDYSQLIADYRIILEIRNDEAFDGWTDAHDLLISEQLRQAIAAAKNDDIDYHWSNMVIDSVQTLHPDKEQEQCGYTLFDLNGDGIDELFWLRRDRSIAAIFTCYEGKPVLVDAFWARSRAYVSQNKELYVNSSSGADNNDFRTYKLLSDGTLQFVRGAYSMYDPETDEVRYFEIVPDETVDITEEEFDELLKDYPYELSEFWLSLDFYSL